MTALEQFLEVERRGRAMRVFCERVRERGGVAVVEEEVDLPRLRSNWRALRRNVFAVARLDELGPTPVDPRRLTALRRQVEARSRRSL